MKIKCVNIEFPIKKIEKSRKNWKNSKPKLLQILAENK